MNNSRAICLFASLWAVMLAPGISQASTISIPVNGGGSIEDNRGENAIVITGSGFSFEGANAGSNGVYCGLNIPCVATTQGDAFGPWSYHGYSGTASVNLGFVSDRFTISSTCVNDRDTLACANLSAGPIPAVFSGSITSASGDFISGTFVGTGTVDLTDGNTADSPVIYFMTAGFNFDGSAALTVTPEPNSIFLLGSGMLLLLGTLGLKARAR